MRALVFAIAVVATPLAHAHGEQSKGSDYSKAEEMPFGRAADPRKAKRTVRVEMTDQMRFSPAQLTVKRDEVVRFVPVNKGQVLHEMVLGRKEDLEAHAELMKKHPGMEHDEPHMVHVAPGKSGEMGWQFSKAGEFYYGCLIPGHFEAGMVGKITVTP
ncbi:MAG TPA: cupredoxin family protein [Burkholderiales bacterium]